MSKSKGEVEFVSREGQYRGMEVLLMINNKQYRNRGFLYRREQQVSSWAVELQLIKQDL